MGQHNPVRCESQRSGVGQELSLCRSSERLTEQKIAIADDAIHRYPRCGAANSRYTGGLKTLCIREGVIAHPDFEQIAEYEECVCLGVSHIAGPNCVCLGLAGVQVEIRDEIHPPPVGLCNQFHWHFSIYSATAFSMITSSLGTSSWKPFLPVLTALILSTTSEPAITLPNTA